MKQRSQEHRRYLRRVAELMRSGALNNQSTLAERRLAVGPELSMGLGSLTNLLYSAADEALSINAAAIEKLWAQSARLFPGERVLENPLQADT